MPFLTLFTAPKPFTNPHIQVIQRNAIKAWKSLADVEVLLIGDEAGIAEAAAEFGVRHVGQVARDGQGIPLVSAVMEIGHTHTTTPMLCYANADMILMSDAVEAARQAAAQVKDFLLVGQRWNLDLSEPFDFSGDWEARLRERVREDGEFYTPWGIDYFIFPRHLYTEVPGFTVGRVAWDNWMVYHARKTFGMAVDGTRQVTAVHQNHDYSHLPGNKPSYGSETAARNLQLAGGRCCMYNILDANREMVNGRIRKPLPRLVRLLRRLEHLFINDSGHGWRWELALRLQRIQRPLAIKPRR
jgi:hypothetical protein